MSIRLFIGGMRGSRSCAGAAFSEFGGDTTSLLVVGPCGERLVLDAGTAMDAVAREMARTGPGPVTVLFSHYHLDHMAGLTMNPLFYRIDWSFRCLGPTFSDGGVREAVTCLLAPPYWPVSWDSMRAKIDFAQVTVDEIRVGALRVRSCSVPHPGGCMAYRIEDALGGRSLVFATDIEWRNRTETQESAFIALCREPKPADLLVIDGHFAEADIDTYAGWGHTCWEDALLIAETAGVRRVLLGHHDPTADDAALYAREREVKKHVPNAALARAGQWTTIRD